jgi:nitroimidazol reductase NimA-like FMN-containing flavoprotein (pyridoxamine 5'-phosphate oxidase superfamily)
MRRKDKEITDTNTLKNILKLTKHVTIALSKNNQPYLVTFSHGYDENRNCIYFHCAKEGKKIDYIKSNNTVWGQAMLDYGYSEGNCNHQFATTQFKGKVTLLDDLDEKRQALQCMIRQLEKNPEQMIEKAMKIDAERLKGTAFGRIDIEYMSGKKPPKLRIRTTP